MGGRQSRAQETLVSDTDKVKTCVSDRVALARVPMRTYVGSPPNDPLGGISDTLLTGWGFLSTSGAKSEYQAYPLPKDRRERRHYLARIKYRRLSVRSSKKKSPTPDLFGFSEQFRTDD